MFQKERKLKIRIVLVPLLYIYAITEVNIYYSIYVYMEEIIIDS